MQSCSVSDTYLKQLPKLQTASLESDLYIEGNTLLKMFKTDEPWKLVKKEHKVELLHDGAKLPHTPTIVEKVKKDNYFAGYRMEFKKAFTSMYEYDFDEYGEPCFFQLMRNTSKDVKKIHRDSRNIIISDLHLDNVLFLNDEHSFCDLDSWQIGSICSETIPSILRDILLHKSLPLVVDQNTDRLSLLASMILVFLDESPLEISAYHYDSITEDVPTLRAIRNLVLNLKDPTKSIPHIPYLHEVIDKRDLPKKMKIKKVFHK